MSQDHLSLQKNLSCRYYEDRTIGTIVDTVVLHSMFCSLSEYGDAFSPEACVHVLNHEQVSTHYIIGREGGVWQLVPEEKKAWHAGESCMPFADDRRESVNDFSIGIELLATKVSAFTKKQYLSLVGLLADISLRHSIISIVGHCHIAQSRKSDPWNFDWHYLKDLLHSHLGKGASVGISQYRFLE